VIADALCCHAIRKKVLEIKKNDDNPIGSFIYRRKRYLDMVNKVTEW